MGVMTPPDLSGVSPEVKAYIDGLSTGYDEMVEQLEKATAVIEDLTDSDQGTGDGDDDGGEGDDDEGDDGDQGQPSGMNKDGEGLADLLKTHPALAEMLTGLKKTADDATKRAEQAEGMAKAERDVRLTAEFVAKAKTLDALAIEHEPVAKALREMAEKCGKDTNDAIWKALAAANEQARTGKMFDELGSGAPGTSSGGSGDQLEKAARSLMAADKDLSYAEALTKAVAADPSLYHEYVSDVRKGA